jgi:hypothetical protein
LQVGLLVILFEVSKLMTDLRASVETGKVVVVASSDDNYAVPLHWNMQSGIYNNSSQVKRIKASGQFDQTSWKPWVQPCFHPLEGKYQRYLDITRYKDTEKQAQKRPDDYSWLKLLKERWRQRRWQAKYKIEGINLQPGHQLVYFWLMKVASLPAKKFRPSRSN